MLFNQLNSTILCEIMERNKSDKGSTNIKQCHHNYTTYYHYLFNSIRYDNILLFELGLGTNNINLIGNMGENGIPGSSLFGWSEYFPNGKIFGADIDKDILFKNDKITTFWCDQTDENIIKNMWDNQELKELEFDIIIEDGLHTFNANICFFENSIHKLKNGGYYIIEDINNSEMYLFNDKIFEWKNKYENLEFTIINLKNYPNIWDNNLILIKKK